MKNIEFHCHTNLSHDCEVSIEERIAEYRKIGYNNLYLTDHDRAQNKKTIIEFNRSLVNFNVRGGIEISTYFGHIILLNCYRKPFFNYLFYLILISKVCNYKIMIPHPWKKFTGLFYQFENSRAPSWYLNLLLDNATYIEVYNHKEGKVETMTLLASSIKKVENLIKISASDSHYRNDIFHRPCDTNGLGENSKLTKMFYSSLRVKKGGSDIRIRTIFGYIKSGLNYFRAK